MKLLKVAAIAAIVFSGSALAGVVPQYGGGVTTVVAVIIAAQIQS